MAENENIKDLLKRKSKLSKDPHKLGELGDLLFQIGYYYFEKAYFKEALEEFERCLEVRKKSNVSLDIATTHRFIGETLYKMGHDLERSKRELDAYFSMTLRMNDFVEIQRAHTTLGNYFMALAEDNYKDNRVAHLNQAFSHYLDSYEILTEISDRKLVDEKEFGLMKARTCLNCAFAMDEKRDLVICNEYLKTAIEICEKYHFYEDLIRCYYIKCDQAKRKNKMEETLKVADRIIEVTQKTKDYVQQSSDFGFVADIYMKVQNFEKAKILLKKAYKLRKKCLISPEIGRKLKEVLSVVKLQKEINLNTKLVHEHQDENENEEKFENSNEKNSALFTIYEKLGDAYCNLGLYELGLNSYFEQVANKKLKLSKNLKKSNSDLALVYSSIAQTYQDLENFKDALKYFELELNTNITSDESEIKSLLNIAYLKEKCNQDFDELKKVYMKAFEATKRSGNVKLQLKVLTSLQEAEKTYRVDSSETQGKIQELRMTKSIEINDEDEDENQEEDENKSIVFSSDSDEDGVQNGLVEDEKLTLEQKFTRSKNSKKYTVKRNLRGETQLHVACIKGNFKQAKKLLEEGHPANERDNLNWLPIHEACNYGHKEIVELLIKHGAKVNDAIGPITPLHDTVQNGHLEVAKLLLDAGAMSYTFTKEGYTPLDFLVKYKEDNESQMTPYELDLYQKIYDKMFADIRQKDKFYKIKRVVIDEKTSLLTDSNDVEIFESNLNSSNGENSVLYGDDLDDQSDSDDGAAEASSAKIKKKKKKAIIDYKSAMSNIGSKALGSGSSFTRPSGVSERPLISETSDNWLIDDLTKPKSSITISRKDISAFTTGGLRASNKRKHPTCESSGRISGSDEDDLGRGIDEIESMDFSAGFRKPTAPKTIDNNDDIIIDESNPSARGTGKKTVTFTSSTSSKKRILDNDVVAIKEVDLTSPVKEPRKNSSFPDKDKENMETITRFLDRGEERSKSDSTLNKQVWAEKNEKVVWKIKAVIDNRNFLIPLADINGRIDDLVVQILSRYKTIFSKDPGYREPTKVLLKSSDDLILFGEDLIKDVLSDSAQVHVLIEAYKEAPKLDEIYENECLSVKSRVYSNVRKALKSSEITGLLDLNEILADYHEISRHFEIIVNSIQLFSKQNVSPNAAQQVYFRNLVKIDLSSNFLMDPTCVMLIENLVSKCVSLKNLNLSNNLITFKSVKTLNECNRQCLESLETLDLSGNELGDENSPDLLGFLNDLLEKSPNLRQLNLSDCRITINAGQRQTTLETFLNQISKSALKSIDFGFNCFDSHFKQEVENYASNNIRIIF